MKRGRGGAEKVRGGETTEGRFAGARACVNDTMLSARRHQPCLPEQQCRRVEHESQLARAWQGSVLLRCFLRLIVLLCTEGKEERNGLKTERKRVSGIFFFFFFGKKMVFSITSPTG